MNKSGADQTKEQTKIRQQLNRHRRRITKQILKSTKNDEKTPIFKNTSGWLTW